MRNNEQRAMMWALIAAGVASRPAMSAKTIAANTEEIMAEYERLHPEPKEEDRERL